MPNNGGRTVSKRGISLVMGTKPNRKPKPIPGAPKVVLLGLLFAAQPGLQVLQDYGVALCAPLRQRDHELEETHSQ